MFLTQRHLMCTWCRNRRLKPPPALVLWACILCACAAQETKPDTLQLGFVNLATAKAPEHLTDPGSFVGGVVVRFVNGSSSHESFAMTDRYGVALVPMRPGNYCADAYGTDGVKLRLDPRLNNAKPVCFSLKSNETKDIGVTISHDQDYKP
jgi:hypothetical protein